VSLSIQYIRVIFSTFVKYIFLVYLIYNVLKWQVLTVDWNGDTFLLSHNNFIKTNIKL